MQALMKNTEIKLTHRELEVLCLAAEGLKSQDIADQLFLSRRTIDFHLNGLYHKLHANNRIQACRAAAYAGLIPFEPTQPWLN